MKALRTRERILAGLLAGAVSLGIAACSSGGGGGLGEETPEPSSGDTPDVTVEDPAEWFAGKTVTMIVPYNPGGGFDNFVRLLAPVLEDELGNGTKVHVVNRPGGGGLVGANEVFQSEPDGLTIGLINYPGSVFAEATETEGVVFDNTEWTFLARLGAINPIVYTGINTPYDSFEAMMQATEPIRFGIGGVGSDAYYATVVLSEVLGIPADIIAGYPGGAEADAALLVGEVDAGVNSSDAALNRISATTAHINVIIGTEEEPEKLPGVPVITEFGDDDQKKVLTALASIYDLERTLVGPPGIDEARADYFAQMIFKAASSDAYTQAMSDAGLTPSPLPRADVVERVHTVTDSIDLLIPYVQAAEG